MSNALYAATATDCYKPGHGALYPKGTERKYANFTPRSAKQFLRSKSCSAFYDNKVVNFGLQGTWHELVELWDRTFFNLPREIAVKRAQRRFDNMCGKGVIKHECLYKLHELGYLPLTVLAIDEGERVNIGVPTFVVYNSLDDDDHYWLVNYLETIVSSYNWKMICNATIAAEYQRVLNHYADRTCDNREHVKFQAHDFSFRGMSGPEDAMRSGSAHLTSFAGTDTIPALDYAEMYYGANSDTELLGASVTATEHAVATTNILYRLQMKINFLKEEGTVITPELHDKLRLEAERDYILEIILQKVPEGIISLVCDSFDFWGVISDVLPSIRAEIESRLKNELGLARVVVRPDSGDPVKVITGYMAYPTEFADRADFEKHIGELGSIEFSGYEVVRIAGEYYEINHIASLLSDFLSEKTIPEVEVRGAIEVLWDSFGGTVNGKGFKCLNEYVGLIYGDSITVERTEQIMSRLERKGYASSNVVLGIGSYTYQYNTRDTFGMAVKATAVQIEEEFVELYKDPKAASSKKSAKGFLRVIKDEEGNFVLEQEADMSWATLETESGELKLFFKNGEFYKNDTMAKIRERIATSL
ncbi:nicotinate phosphoribosyltransferase [Pseudomonas phage BRkr]|nr:nicotinate phosphoribosyltransferase [Pseudomonas phage BRkr]